MQRQIKSDKPVQIKAPNSPRSAERELDDALDYMISQISQRFRNNALKGLNASTVDKFADAQVGNYASVFLKLAKQTQRRLMRQFDDDRIEAMVSGVMGKVDKRNREQLYAMVEKRIGLSTTELTRTEGLSSQINALTLETAQWAKKLRDETLELYTANSLRAMTLGQSLPDILSEFDGLVEKRKNHAKFTARNQVANFNSITTKLRAQNLGITKAVWVTAGDERVRPSHEQRDGKEFNLDKGLHSSVDGKWLLPGVDYQCRCTYELVVSDD